MGSGITSADDPTINQRSQSRTHNTGTNRTVTGTEGVNTTNTNTNNTGFNANGPLQQQFPYFNDMWGKASTAMNSVNGQAFGGPFIASATGMERGAIAGGANTLASGGIGQGAGAWTGMLTDTLNGKYLDPASNPFLVKSIEVAQRPVTENFTEVALPAISDRSIAQGAYGGARQDIQENQATRDYTRTMGDIASRMAYENYAMERANMMGAGGQLGASYAAQMAPTMWGLQLGGAERAMNDLDIQNSLAQFREGQAAAFRGLPEMAQILTAGGFGQGMSSGSSQTSGVNLIDSITRAMGRTSATGTSRGRGYVEDPNADSGFQNFMESVLGGGALLAGIGGSNGFKWW